MITPAKNNQHEVVYLSLSQPIMGQHLPDPQTKLCVLHLSVSIFRFENKSGKNNQHEKYRQYN